MTVRSHGMERFIDSQCMRRIVELVSSFVLVVLVTVIPGYPQGLGDLYRVTQGVSDAHVEFHDYEIRPGQEKVLADLDGPAKVTYFYITDDSLFHRTDSSGFAYPGLVLKVYWDGSDMPSIQVPLWEFFGNFNRESVDYASLPMQVNHWRILVTFRCHFRSMHDSVSRTTVTRCTREALHSESA
jgi:hypothetical protein